MNTYLWTGAGIVVGGLVVLGLVYWALVKLVRHMYR